MVGSSSSFPDIPNQEQEEALQMLHLLEQIDRITTTGSPEIFIHQTLSLVILFYRAQSGILLLLDPEKEHLVLQGMAGIPGLSAALDEMEFPLSGIAGLSLKRKQIVVINPVHCWNEWKPAVDDPLSLKPERTLVFPLFLRGEPVGVIQLFNHNLTPNSHLLLLGNRIAAEIEQMRQLQASLRRSQRLRALISIIGKISSVLDRDQILRLIINYGRELLDVESCSLFLTDPESGDYILKYASGSSPHDFEEIRVPAGKGIIGHVIQTGQTVLSPDVFKDKRHYNGVDLQTGFITRSILAVPLHLHALVLGGERGSVEEGVIGGMEAVNKRSGEFDEDDLDIFLTLANQAATVLQVARLYREANQLFIDTITALTEAIDARDPYTIGHSRRVSEFAVEIANEMNLSKEDIHQLRIASLLHDVGKIGVPDSILTKPERLTEEEYLVMKQHAAIGERILNSVHILQPMLAGLAEHHERPDGKGYPRGLSGDQISKSGLILAVADVFDALTSDRHYQQAIPVDEAIAILREGAGTKYDSAAISALERAYRAGKIKTEPERRIG